MFTLLGEGSIQGVCPGQEMSGQECPAEGGKCPREMSVVGKETARTPPDWLSLCWSGPRAV